MKVSELMKILEGLKPDQEIRYESYEFLGDFPITEVIEEKYEDSKYYCIGGDC